MTERRAHPILSVCAAPDGDHAAVFDLVGHGDWPDIVELAWEKRAAPLLHRALSRSGRLASLPGEAAARLGACVKWHTFNALRQSAALTRLYQVLGKAGMVPVALKGTRLAYRDYPRPHLRPMRDIDLLLEPDQAELAQALLTGHEAYELAPWGGRYGLEHGHQLPELRDIECGTTIEIHHRLNARGWAQEGRLLVMVRAQAEDLLVSARTIRVPSATANLLHIVEHATLHHLFENGRLLLSDLHYIAADPELDWAVVIAQAEAMGLARSLCLTAAVAAHHGARWVPAELAAGIQAAAPHVAVASTALLASAGSAREQALLRRLERRSGRRPGLAGALGRLLRPDPAVLAKAAGTTAGSPRRWLGYPAWLASRGALFLRSMRRPDTAAAAGAQVAMLNWLERG